MPVRPKIRARAASARTDRRPARPVSVRPDAGPITGRQLRWLKQRAHQLKPIVIVGQRGLTDAVLDEIARALDDHELIKIKVHADDRVARDALASRIAERGAAALVQRIGNTACYYRRNPRHRQPLELPLI